MAHDRAVLNPGDISLGGSMSRGDGRKCVLLCDGSFCGIHGAVGCQRKDCVCNEGVVL